MVIAYCSDGVVVINDNSGSVTYVNGTKKTFKIKGELTSSSIDNISNVKEVEIGSDVTSIGRYAFSDCSGLMSVTIPNSVTSIGPGVFIGCDNLVEYHMPGFTINQVKTNAFDWGLGIDGDYCKFLVVVYCSDGVVVINEG